MITYTLLYGESAKAFWRKADRVELSQERLTSLTGFEVQPHHRMRLPSFAKREYNKHYCKKLKPLAHPAIGPY